MLNDMRGNAWAQGAEAGGSPKGADAAMALLSKAGAVAPSRCVRAARLLGLGRVVALHYRSPTSCHIC
jgi:hypothetical protein